MRILILVIAAMAAVTTPVFAQPCEADAGRSAVLLSREIAGDRDYIEVLEGPEWTFTLKRSQYGWDIRLLDKNGVDLTQMTPPQHGTNSRQIYGWHFRNADNTASNKGDVNAPQKLHLFGIEPALSGTGGYRPNDAGGVDPANQSGRGALTIEDFGLADLEPGEKARLNYLNFKVCMNWH